MKCHICGHKAALCFSNWPEPGEICLCEEHCSDGYLYQAQKDMRENKNSRQSLKSKEKLSKAG